MAEKYVTRRVVEEKQYDVFKKDGKNLVFLDTMVVKKGESLDEKKIAEDLKVPSVILQFTGNKVAKYGIPVDEFMKQAKFVGYMNSDEKETETEPKTK